MKDKTLEDVYRFIHQVAGFRKWELPADESHLRNIAEGLKANYNKYGYFQCPCRDSWGEREKDKDIICPCLYCPPDIEEYGHCFCGLFLSMEFMSQNKALQSIPDRRPDELYP